MHHRIVLLIASVIAWLVPSQAKSVDYDVVYVAIPRPADDSKPTLQDVETIHEIEPGAHLRIVHPDGSTEVLYQPTAGGGVLDPKVSLDGEWVYFAQCLNCTYTGNYLNDFPVNLHRINLATRDVEQLTFSTLKGEFNTGPCEVPGGRLLFTSSRNKLSSQARLPPPLNKALPVMQGFALQLSDPENTVELTNHFNLRGWLHPELMKDGWVVAASAENHGLRPAKEWSIWRTLPDGRKFQPVWSGFVGGISVLHFQSIAPDGRVQIVFYYAGKSSGHGTLLDMRQGMGFGNPNKTLNPTLDGKMFPFLPVSNPDPFSPEPPTRHLTGVWTDHNDSGLEAVSYPSGTVDGLLCSVATFNQGGGTGRRIIESGLYHHPLGPDGHLIVTQSRADLALIVDDPAFYEVQPRAVLSWEAIYGAPPVEHQWLPDSTEGGQLKTYGYVGTSTVHVRESKQVNGDGYDADKWEQGADTDVYDESEVAGMRIVYQHPTPAHYDTKKWKVDGVERMGSQGEGPVETDGSFLWKIPADTSFGTVLIDAYGRALTMPGTWKQVRPGESRTDCRGCHAHHQPATVEFDQTIAGGATYEPRDTTGSLRFSEYLRDVKPILTTKCAPCHTGNGAGNFNITDNLRDDRTVAASGKKRINPFRSRRSAVADYAIDPMHAPVPLTDDEIWRVVFWIDCGAPRGAGFFNGLPPEGTWPDEPDEPDEELPAMTQLQRIERLETEVFGEPYPGGAIP